MKGVRYNDKALTKCKESLLFICPDLWKQPFLMKTTELRDFSILGPEIQAKVWVIL